MLGRFSLHVPESGMVIHKIRLHYAPQRQQQFWLTTPSEIAILGSGKSRFTPLVEFSSKEERFAFTEKALEAALWLLEREGVIA